MFPAKEINFKNNFLGNKSAIGDDFPDKIENISRDFDVNDDLVTMYNEELTTNAEYFASTHFQIEHDEHITIHTTTPIM